MRRLDKLQRIDIVASQQHVDAELPLVTAQEAEAAAWTVAPSADAGGEPPIKVGGARAIALALAVARQARWPLVAWRRPLALIGAPWVLDRVYAVVAANRRRLPGDTPFCLAHPDSCAADSGR